MKIEDIKTKAEVDLKVDNLALDDESLSTSIIHRKWLDILHVELVELKKCENELKKIYRARWLYYSGKAEPQVYEKEGDFNIQLMKQDLTMFIESDELYLKAKDSLDSQKEKVNYIDSVIKVINNRHWNIRNAIEWRKYTQWQAD